MSKSILLKSQERTTKNHNNLESVEGSNRKLAKDDTSARQLELLRSVNLILNNFFSFFN